MRAATNKPVRAGKATRPPAKAPRAVAQPPEGRRAPAKPADVEARRRIAATLDVEAFEAAIPHTAAATARHWATRE
jgi:hypothetical protein